MVCVGSELLMNSCAGGRRKRLMVLVRVYARLCEVNIVPPLSLCWRARTSLVLCLPRVGTFGSFQIPAWSALTPDEYFSTTESQHPSV